MRKLYFGMILVAIMVLATGSISAQQLYGYCGDLSEADCTTLRNIVVAESGSVTGNITVNVTLDEALYSAGIVLDGSYISNPEAVAMYREFSNMTPDEVFKTIYADTDSLVQFITDLFKMGDANLTLSIDIPPAITSGMVPTPLTVDLWMVDGVGYTDLAAFSFADPTLEGVWGVDFVALYTNLFEMVFSDPEVERMFSEALSNTPAMGDFSDTSMYAEFMTLSRLADETVDGQTMAVFEMTFDYGAFFGSEVMRNMMAAQMEMQSALIQNMEPGMSDEEVSMMEDTLTAVMDAYAIAFDKTTLTTTYKIGMDDSYVHATEVIFRMDVDTVATFEAFSSAISPTDENALPENMGFPEVFKLDILITTQSGEFDTITSVPLPDGVQIVPESLLNMMQGSDS